MGATFSSDLADASPLPTVQITAWSDLRNTLWAKESKPGVAKLIGNNEWTLVPSVRLVSVMPLPIQENRAY